MPWDNARQSTLMGRDADSQWVHWLALSRHNKPASMSGTLSSGPFPSSPSKASSNIGDSKPLRPRSSATNYFALLSANEDGHHDGRSFTNHKQHGNVSGLTTRDMDSSWVAWFTEREHQHQLADVTETLMRERARSFEQSFLNNNDKSLPPSGIQQLQLQSNSRPQGPENAVLSNTATTTSASAGFGSVGTTSPLPFSVNNFLDSDIDSLDTFSELLSGFGPALPSEPSNIQANGAAGPCDTDGFDDGDFTWLEAQHACPLSISDESGLSSPNSKRSREEYPGGYPTNDGQTLLEGITTSKKQKFVHPWAGRLDTSSPSSSSVL